jgi:hypothetical protein
VLPLLGRVWAAEILVAGLLAAGLAGCGSTQRFPRPMPGPDDLAPGVSDLFPEGPEQALVLRHGDSVHVKHAGQDAVFQLRHFDKQVRIRAGAAVLSDASGRAEIVFPRDSRATLFGMNVVVLGSPSRGEPLLYIVETDTVEVTLGVGEYVVLPGGCQLSGPGGPFVIEQHRDEILILRNRAPEIATVKYRDAMFELNPGEVVHLPRLEVGTAPMAYDADARPLPVGVAEATLWGELEVVRSDERMLVVEAGVDPQARPHEIRAFGLLIRLDANQRVALEDISSSAIQPDLPSPGPVPAADPALSDDASNSESNGAPLGDSEPEGNQL